MGRARCAAAIGPCGSRKVKCVDWVQPPSRGNAKSAGMRNRNTLQSDRDRSSGAACVAFIPAPSRPGSVLTDPFEVLHLYPFLGAA